METIFWISAFLIFYHFIGYGLLITLLSKLKKKQQPLPELSDYDLPEVSLVIAAYNEEEIIDEKIKNSFALDYPSDKLKVHFITDGSTDRTTEIISYYDQLRLWHKPMRAGKIAAINRIMPQIQSHITIFSDANVMINREGIKQLISHFQNNRIAVVSGEKTIVKKDFDNASGSGEGFYWKYESYLKKKDAEWNTLVGSAGELFAMRTHLFTPVEQGTLIEDFVMTMRIAADGYKVAYEPKAMALETASESVSEEKKRKIRISAGGIQAVIKLLPLLNFFKYGKLSFQYISHRALRWTLIPIALLSMLVLSTLLAETHWIYELAFRGQTIFYLLAFAGYALREAKTSTKFIHVPYYFVFMHLCVVLGWIKYFRGKQSVTWEKSKRAQMVRT